MTSDKIQNLGCNLDDPKLQQTLSRIASLPDLAHPLVCLPDIHMKEKTEAPCSFVAATKDAIIPELTAPSVGCGMGLIATSLTRADITPKALDAFYAEMRAHRGARYGTLKNIALWFGILQRPQNKYDFSDADLADAARNGAKAAVQKYNLPQEILEHVEYGGDAMDQETEKIFPLSSLLPRAAWVSGKHDIGYGFKGNHFLEVQYVEKIADEETARSWGLQQGQIVIMYHGGGGAVSHYVGRYFARRKKDTNSVRSRAFLFVAKLLFHFGSREGIRYASERWRYYFHPKPFQEIPADSYEGRRLLAATAASLNYSYAFRMGIVKRVFDALHIPFGERTETRLVWDTIHNAIRKEHIGEREYIVHRHTATRTFPGKPVIISGFNNTNSYLGIGLPNAEEHLFSADHGAGETIKQHSTNGKTQAHPENHITEIHTTKPPYKEKVPHITNEGLDAVTRPLEEAGVMRPVAYLRPIAVFKG